MSDLNNLVAGGLKRRPWIGVALGVIVGATLCGLAGRAWQRLSAFGDAPERLSAGEALRQARTRDAWVELTDARFSCEGSVELAGTRYGRLLAPSLGETVALVSAEGPLCPPPDRPLTGAFDTMSGRRRSLLVDRGLREAADEATLVLSLKDGPDRARSDAWALLGLAAMCFAIAPLGYLIRWSDAQAARRAAAALTHEELRRRLGRGRLRLRPRCLLNAIALTLLLVPINAAATVIVGAAAVQIPRAVLAQPSRWAAAEPVAVESLVSAAFHGHTGWTDDYFTDLVVSFRAAGEEQEVSYLVAWAPEVSPDIEVRRNGQELMTSAEPALKTPRLVVAAASAGVAAALLLLVLKLAGETWARVRAVRRAASAPELVLLQVRDLREQRHNGVLSGWECEYLNAQGQVRREKLGYLHPPALDDAGAHVLAVRPRGEPGAEAILVATDGYPFRLGA
ncbi:hypothetical protein AB3662_06685 [Sorangium cellulosum]|uniref:hypothetical protein n=1 Tax=Sorangium cellulosum TaxID=56 RepID=UPI003D9A9A15